MKRGPGSKLKGNKNNVIAILSVLHGAMEWPEKFKGTYYKDELSSCRYFLLNIFLRSSSVR